MRFEQQISAGLRVVVSGVVGLCLFASGRPLSASEQNPTAVLQPPRAAPPVASEIQISSDEAVRMALENNLATLLRTTEDRIEGAKAFVEKRKPRFTGA